MTEEEFWKCTPKKLDALYDIHCKVKGYNDKNNETGYIDDIFF
ncbi:hypothetical protein [Clostridium felsineum]|nr:hypothetical protein [Clostridium felsineum]